MANRQRFWNQAQILEQRALKLRKSNARRQSSVITTGSYDTRTDNYQGMLTPNIYQYAAPRTPHHMNQSSYFHDQSRLKLFKEQLALLRAAQIETEPDSDKQNQSQNQGKR